MALTNWIHKYPRVQALVQQDPEEELWGASVEAPRPEDALVVQAMPTVIRRVTLADLETGLQAWHAPQDSEAAARGRADDAPGG